ncbi:hypothetical protein LTR62_007339 [Meristemomyces frigidus]|uniref:Zn(2)-C6 fungal-type domain-containing protein n=1 Tax=Meristemomyces frigidus TaxID=1508187 RepID=A0AAN7TMC1_9PEZI|nr:hypothetical protein LTR62_007339 [Meristemomyces frigidus]
MMTTDAVHGANEHFAMMSRPQIGIDRLPVRRQSNEPKEAMNCKSCRKRKIKCTRVRPSCEACQVFNCACIYDAIPKKRGPKTDVLEALLKRVNGLEKRLKDEKKPDNLETEEQQASGPQQAERPDGVILEAQTRIQDEPVEVSPAIEAVEQPTTQQTEQRIDREFPRITAQTPSQPFQQAQPVTDTLLDTYFTRVHGKPYYILDEQATRQKVRESRMPRFLLHAIYAISVRYSTRLYGDHVAASTYCQEYALQSRAEIDVDEPTIEHLQALLLLAMTAFKSGKGKKSYMLLTHAVGMAFGLSLHRELPSQLRIASAEREGRRKLFWTCYLMDRFMVAGSKRPSLISDESVCLRLPAWLLSESHIWHDGSFFRNGSTLPYEAGVSNAGQGSGAMLVKIARVLGVTNRYLAAGGVKGDSHFPWHAQSTLSQIRSDLDEWAAETQHAYITIEGLFARPDAPALVLSKLIYHLVYCLVYRPFLPVDLAELSGTGQHQSWQIEATNLCFGHANAIAELIEYGKSAPLVDWPSFVGYCICTAGTIHVHGAHYMTLRAGDVFAHSAEYLSREMSQLHELRHLWTGVQHQRETLQAVYASHSQLVKSLSTSPLRFSPVFQMEDFFDRYPGSYIDGSHCSFTDVDPASLNDGMLPYNGYDTSSIGTWPVNTTVDMQTLPLVPTQYMTQNQMPDIVRKPKRRRMTAATMPSPASVGMNTSPAHRRISAGTTMPDPQPHHIQPLQTQQPTSQRDSHNTDNPATANLDPSQIPGLTQHHTLTLPALSPCYTYSPHDPFPPLPNPKDLGSESYIYNNIWLGGDYEHETNIYTHGGTFLEQQQTPGGFSQGVESAHTDSMDRDPFLSLLEQLAQGEGSGGGEGLSELDFYLSGQG